MVWYYRYMVNSPDYSYRGFITTGGLGSRVASETQGSNKALLKINNKTAIEHIVDAYPENIEIVVGLGYRGFQVEEFLRTTYPDRRFIFAQGPDPSLLGVQTSLGGALLHASPHLDCPFVFTTNDTHAGPIPAPDRNWIGGSKGLDPVLYNRSFLETFTTKDGVVTGLRSRTNEVMDLEEEEHFHIGLIGVKDHVKFWEALRKAFSRNPDITKLSDYSALQIMLEEGVPFHLQSFPKWYDTGNLKTLAHTRANLKHD